MKPQNMQKVDTWDYNAVALIKAMCRSPFGLDRFKRDPVAAAAGAGFALSPAFAKDIQKLNVWTHLPEVRAEVDEEVSDFFSTTVTDGRFIGDWLNDPEGVASRLGVYVSPDAVKRIQEIATAANVSQLPGTATARMAPLVIAIVIVIAFGPKECRPQRLVVQPDDLGRF